MKLVTKIAITASILFFLLTQIFSSYIILDCQREKIEMIKSNEIVLFENKMSSFYHNVNENTIGDIGSGNVLDNYITYSFRSSALDNCGLYMEERCLFNNSPFDFDVEQGKELLSIVRDRNRVDPIDRTYEVCGDVVVEEKIDDKHIFIFYKTMDFNSRSVVINIYHTLDITDLYKSSRQMVIKALVISVVMSFVMLIILNLLIQKITVPLKNINETQKQLIGGLSHELKTPLTAMKGYSETILKVNISKEQEERALSYIYSECSRLSRLTEKMMYMTKLYDSECKVELEKVNILELVNVVKVAEEHNLSEHNIKLEILDINPNLNKLLDQDLVVSLLINLINNGIQASVEGSNIYIGADEKSIWVRDEGHGIPAEELANVMKAFYRVDKSRSSKSGNMGLGLSLCHRIAEVHKGTLNIESEEGKGTTVTFIY